MVFQDSSDTNYSYLLDNEIASHIKNSCALSSDEINTIDSCNKILEFQDEQIINFNIQYLYNLFNMINVHKEQCSLLKYFYYTILKVITI